MNRQERNHWRQFDPFTQPDWAWREAVRIAATAARMGQGLAPVIREAALFLRDTRYGRRRRGPHDSAIAQALALHEAGGPRLWEMGARVLADEAAEVIADKCGLALEVIRWYEALFFAVRPRLASWAWVCTQVIGRGLRYRFGDHGLGRVWAACAYFGGAVVLDTLIAAFRACGQQPSISAHLAPDSGVAPELKAMLAMLVLPAERSLDWMCFGWQLRLLEGVLLQCPDAAAGARERVGLEIVDRARMVLARKPASSHTSSQPEERVCPAASLPINVSAGCGVHAP